MQFLMAVFVMALVIPVFLAISFGILLLYAGILHVCFRLLGGRADYTGIARAVFYTIPADIFAAIPLVGLFVCFGWSVASRALAGAAIHGVSKGRGFAAVLLSLLPCCAVGVAAFVVVVLAAGAAVAQGGGLAGPRPVQRYGTGPDAVIEQYVSESMRGTSTVPPDDVLAACRRQTAETQGNVDRLTALLTSFTTRRDMGGTNTACRQTMEKAEQIVLDALASAAKANPAPPEGPLRRISSWGRRRNSAPLMSAPSGRPATCSTRTASPPRAPASSTRGSRKPTPGIPPGRP
jgi:hypothetical protein